MTDAKVSSTLNNNDNASGSGSNGKSRANNQDPTLHVEPPRREDLQPSYARVLKPDTEDESAHGWYGSMINTLGSVVGTLGAIPCCIVCPNPYKPVNQGNVGLVTKFGRFARAVDPGLVKVNPLSEKLTQIDVKIQISGMSLLHRHRTSSQELRSLRPSKAFRLLWRRLHHRPVQLTDCSIQRFHAKSA